MIYEKVRHIRIDQRNGPYYQQLASDTKEVQVGVGGSSVNVRVQNAATAEDTLSIYPMDIVQLISISY